MDMSEDDELLGHAASPPTAPGGADEGEEPVDGGEESDEEVDNMPMGSSRVCGIECAHSTLACLL